MHIKTANSIHKNFPFHQISLDWMAIGDDFLGVTLTRIDGNFLTEDDLGLLSALLLCSAVIYSWRERGKHNCNCNCINRRGHMPTAPNWSAHCPHTGSPFGPLYV
jgi:L-rhamnose isomerase